MLKSLLRRLRLFMAADVTASLDQVHAALHEIQAENAALRGDLAARDAKENALAKHMEAALLTIALNRNE